MKQGRLFIFSMGRGEEYGHSSDFCSGIRLFFSVSLHYRVCPRTRSAMVWTMIS